MVNPVEALLEYLGQKIIRHVRSHRPLGEFSYPTLSHCRRHLKILGYDHRQTANALYYLKKRKYIKLRKKTKPSEVAILLTLSGTIRFLKEYPLVDIRRTISPPKRNIFIVAVPESKRRIRDFLRLKLTKDGFALVARGIYSTNHPFSPHIRFFIELLNLQPYVLWGEFREK